MNDNKLQIFLGSRNNVDYHSFHDRTRLVSSALEIKMRASHHNIAILNLECRSFLVQNFTYTWFCRGLTDPVHPTDAEGRPQVYNTHAIPAPTSVAGNTGGGCFGKGPGTEPPNKIFQ